jgi:Golgi nucleoside diphosphatase
MHAAKAQGFRIVGGVLGVLWLGVIGVLLQFNYFPGVNSSTATFTVGFMTTSINVVAFCNRQIFELLLFFSKNIYSAVMHPSCYVLINAKMAVEELAEKDVAARKERHKRMSLVASFKIKSIGDRVASRIISGNRRITSAKVGFKSMKKKKVKKVDDRISSGKF